MEPTFGFFFFNDTATTEIYTLPLHDALPIFGGLVVAAVAGGDVGALGGHAAADRRADPPRPTGDEGHPPGELVAGPAGPFLGRCHRLLLSTRVHASRTWADAGSLTGATSGHRRNRSMLRTGRHGKTGTAALRGRRAARDACGREIGRASCRERV